MTLNLPILYFVWTGEYCQTSPNKNKSPNLWHVTRILVCCIFGWRNWKVRRSQNTLSSIILKPEHLIRDIEVDEKHIIFPNDTASLLPIDMKNYGRCYTLNLPSRFLRNGVSKIRFVFASEVKVFAHNKGVLSMYKQARKKFVDVNFYKRYFVNVEHNIYEMLDLDGKLCEDEQNYRDVHLVSVSLLADQLSSQFLIFLSTLFRDVHVVLVCLLQILPIPKKSNMYQYLKCTAISISIQNVEKY